MDRLALVAPSGDLGGLVVQRLLRCAAVPALVDRKDVDAVRRRGEQAEVRVVPLDVLCEAVDEDDVRLGLGAGREPLRVLVECIEAVLGVCGPGRRYRYPLVQISKTSTDPFTACGSLAHI